MKHGESLEKEIRFYEFVRSNVGSIYHGIKIRGILGINTNTSMLYSTRAMKYVISHHTATNSWRRRQRDRYYRIEDRIWVDRDLVVKNVNGIYKKKHPWVMWHSYKPVLGMILIDAPPIPWWLLDKFNGPIDENEIVKRVEKYLLYHPDR